MRRTRAGTADALARRFDSRGGAAYLGEQVTIAEHMLQAAALAASSGAAEPLVVAALVHDIGHLVDEDASATDWHRRHDTIGGAYLERWFEPAVSEPVRLHVEAKRYLCAVEPDYLARLSPASLHTLGLQGGPMEAAEIKDFEAHPRAPEAVRLRRWDEAAKVPGRAVPEFSDYRRLVESLAVV